MVLFGTNKMVFRQINLIHVLYRFTLLLFLTNYVFQNSQAQNRSLVWNSKFENKIGWSNSTGIVQGVNDNIFSVGFGNFPNSSNEAISQNGILVCQDRLGNEKWTKIFGGSNSDRFLSIENTIDGNIIVVGTTNSLDGDLIGTTNRDGLDGWVIKFDTLGSIIWQKTFNIPDGEDVINSISTTEDGGYVFCGNTNINQAWSDILIIKIDVNGNETWRKIIHGDVKDEANQVVSKNGNIYVVGNTDSNIGDINRLHGYKDDVVVIKLNNSGTIIWKKIIGGFYEDSGVSLDISGDGGVVVACETRSCDGDILSNNGCFSAFYFPKFFLFKLNNLNGEFLWKRDVYNSYISLAKYVKTSSDGNIIACGVPDNFYFSKINQTNGQDLWPQGSGETSLNNFNYNKTSFTFDNEGGYLVSSSGGVSYFSGIYNTAKICPRILLIHNINSVFCKGDSMSIERKYIGEPIADSIKLFFNINDELNSINLDTLGLYENKKIKLPDSAVLGYEYLVKFNVNKSNIAPWGFNVAYFGPSISISGNILSGKDDPNPSVEMFLIGKPPFHVKINEHVPFEVNENFAILSKQVIPKVGKNTYFVETISDECGYEGLKTGMAKIEKSNYCTTLEPNMNFFSDSSGYINDFILKDKSGLVYENRNSKNSDFTYYQSQDTIRIKKNKEYEIHLELNKPRGDVLAWIDYNRDNIFSNNEIIYNTIFSGNLNGINESTFNFNINQNIQSGPSRLRLRFVSQNREDFLACNKYAENEIEDYNINILDNEEPSIFLRNSDFYICKGKLLSMGQSNLATFSPNNIFKALIRKKEETAFTEISSSNSLPVVFGLPNDIEINKDYIFKIISTEPYLESIEKGFKINSLPKLSLSGLDIITKEELGSLKVNFEGIPPFDFGFLDNSPPNGKAYQNNLILDFETKVSSEYFPSYVKNACGFGSVDGKAIVEVRDSLPTQLLDCFNLNEDISNQIGASIIENFGATFSNSTSNNNFGLEFKSEEQDYMLINKKGGRFGSFTSSFWFKFQSPAQISSDLNIPILISKFESVTSISLHIAFDAYQRQLIYRMKYYNDEIETIVDLNVEWNNLVIVQSTNFLEIYLNNKLLYSNYTSVYLGIPDTWLFGKDGDYYFDGIIDEIKFFSGKINRITINELYLNHNSCSLNSLNCSNYGFVKNPITKNSEIKVLKSIEAINSIKSTGNVIFEAGNHVLLRPGFEVEKGGLFKVDIQNCSN